MTFTMKDIRRFNKFFDMGLGSDCWEWQGSGGSYGSFSLWGRSMKAHRVSKFLDTGTWGACCLHACDNPRCINPKHLTWGTQAENMADKVRKGRQARGETSGRSKLSATDVLEIRRLYDSGDFNQCGLAEMYGVNQSQICRILSGALWAHV